MPTRRLDFRPAQRHLSRADQVLRQLIATVGPCTLRPGAGDHFALLVRAIISQQISGKAAASISARLTQVLASRGLTPHGILQFPVEQLRSVGLSAAKAAYVRDLAEKVLSGAVALKGIHRVADEEIIDRLIAVKGIGRWTAEMFLIFSLGRLDVLPVGDLGFRSAVQRLYGLEELPEPAYLRELAEPWRPYRSVATWYFWRSTGFVPYSGIKQE